MSNPHSGALLLNDRQLASAGFCEDGLYLLRGWYDLTLLLLAYRVLVEVSLILLFERLFLRT